MAQQLTTCTFCGVGCGLYLESDGRRITGVYPSASHPTNLGKACVRGWHVHEVASSPDRIKHPYIRKEGRLHAVTWEEAIDHTATRLTELKAKYGPDSMAFLNSPRCSNEESYLLQKFARAVIGTNNVDHGAGVYCNNSLNVLLDTLGVAACTNSIWELTRSDVIIVDGVDLNRQLPTIAGWVLRAKLGGAKLICIDIRRNRVAESADLFLQIKPGTEGVLYGAMAKVIVDRALANLPFVRAYCSDYEQFLTQVLTFDLLRASEECGVSPAIIEQAALAYARAPRAALLYSTGIEARDRQSIQAVVNLVLLCGQLGKEGAGLFPLSEHNNLQGVCDVGMLPDRLPGYRLVTDRDARAAMESHWRARLPDRPGLGAPSLLSSDSHSPIKSMWLCRYDPVRTALFGDAVDCLSKCELVVVQHLFMTDSARHADVLLPTTGFGEEQVSFTSTERRIQLAERVIEPLPGTLPVWDQLTRLANAMGARWTYRSAAAVMDEIGEVVPFYSGANYGNLAREYGRQWPCSTDHPMGTPRLFASGQHRRFRFTPLKQPSLVADVDAQFPLTLVFGHSLYYWHNSVLTQHSETLRREYRVLLLDYPEGFVEINAEDAAELGIRDRQKIHIRAAHGSAVSRARVTPEVRKGSIFGPYFVWQLKKQLLDRGREGSSQVQVRLEKDVA